MAEKNMKRKNYYTSGNAAVSVQAAPEIQTEEEYLREVRRKVEEKVKIKSEERREFSRAQIFVLALSISVMVALASLYILQISNYYMLKTEISNLKYTYETTVQSNALMKNEIERGTALDEVYAYATNILGMHAPESYQIVRYEKNETEYIHVDGAIPNE